MTRPTLIRRLAAAAVLLACHPALAVPVAVNDAYSVNEDTLLATGGGSLLTTGFEVVVPHAGAWQYLDKIKNDQAGQTPDTYPTDGAARNWKALNFDVATSTVGPWKSSAMPIAGGVVDY